MTAQTDLAYAARSTAARKAAQEIAAQDRPFTAEDEERAARLITYVERCYELTYEAAWKPGGKGIFSTERIFHDRQETRRAWAEIRKARAN